MTERNLKEHTNTDDASPAENAGETRSGTPNPADPNRLRDREHKSGYGGEGGEPRTSSDQRQDDET
jgi:hypothetical protein